MPPTGDGVVIANMNDKRNEQIPDDEDSFRRSRVAHRQSIPVSELRVIVRLIVVKEASKRVIE